MSAVNNSANDIDKRKTLCYNICGVTKRWRSLPPQEEVKVSFTFLLIMEGGMSVNNYITFEMLMDFCTLLVAIIALFVGIYNKKR